MFIKAYSILDVKSGVYSQPWFFSSDVHAVRAVCVVARDKSTTIGQYPADFVLFWVGEFDDNVGLLSSPLPARSLGVVAALMAEVSGG